MKSSTLELLRNLILKTNYYEAIGPHVRHIIERYRTVINSAISNHYTLNYDKKVRDSELERNPFYAAAVLLKIDDEINILSKSRTCLVDDNYISSYGRELYYCEEHTIHHCAIIRYKLKENNEEHLVGKHFGVAKATIEHGKINY